MNKSSYRTYHLHQRDLILESRDRVLLVGYFVNRFSQADSYC